MLRSDWNLTSGTGTDGLTGLVILGLFLQWIGRTGTETMEWTGSASSSCLFTVCLSHLTGEMVKM